MALCFARRRAVQINSTTWQGTGGSVFEVPEAIDLEVAKTKLASLDLTIDELTEFQKTYMESWDIGT